MSESFLILSRRFGGDIRDPSDGDLEDALKQVFIEDHPQLTEADYEDELVPALHLHRVTFDDALRLWKLARDKNISGLRQEPWVQS